MKKYLVGFVYSLPVQLFFLHLRRYQILLLFWYILFATVNGTFLKTYGAYSLYLSPEYMGEVNALSSSMVGVSIGIFIMSWNITTFILHGKHLKFLATTANPFLKYCINNSVIPLLFLIFYMVKATVFNRDQQLESIPEMLSLIGGFIFGLFSAIFIAFAYFFGADKSIYRGVASVINTANKEYLVSLKENTLPQEKKEMRVDYFLSAHLRLRKPRDTRHYSHEFLDSIFKRHHIAAVISISLAIAFLLIMGFFLDKPIFQVPAGASITVLFAVLISVAGAFTLFLKNWSFVFLIAGYILVSWMVKNEIIDMRNKAYGLDYTKPDGRPFYTKESIAALASDSNVAFDKLAYIQMLNHWKAKQDIAKPVMYFINVSGGGNRSASFTLNMLQHLDSITNGQLMKQTMLITGASGGMLGAAYFREMYYRRQHGEAVNMHDVQYADNISKDLLNPLFSSFVARDITSPAQRVTIANHTYIKDRGYLFEKKLIENTGGFLDKDLGDYVQPEQRAEIPLMFFNSVITRDGRRMMISSTPARFMMKPQLDSTTSSAPDVDMVDFVSLFKNLDPHSLRISSALRMNATFPFVLPNVWLPTYPVIDVMDAGLRDNFGTETTLRFIHVFQEWIRENTSKVVIIEIRDRRVADWETPEDEVNALTWLTTPITLLQHNWFKIQDYYHADQLAYATASPYDNIHRVMFQYVPAKKERSASLSFHLTNVEKLDIKAAVKDSINQQASKLLLKLSAPINSYKPERQ
jgi:hypothetical protein